MGGESILIDDDPYLTIPHAFPRYPVYARGLLFLSLQSLLCPFHAHPNTPVFKILTDVLYGISAVRGKENTEME